MSWRGEAAAQGPAKRQRLLARVAGRAWGAAAGTCRAVLQYLGNLGLQRRQ
jgi:hypothetical protein